MAIMVSSNLVYAMAMLKTTPLLVTVGLSLTMPLAVIGDLLLHNPVNGPVIMGAILALLGFVIVGMEGLHKSPDTMPYTHGEVIDVERT